MQNKVIYKHTAAQKNIKSVNHPSNTLKTENKKETIKYNSPNDDESSV